MQDLILAMLIKRLKVFQFLMAWRNLKKCFYMKISIGTNIKNGPWGGGNLFAINLSNF